MLNQSMRKNQRQEKILLSLIKLRYATRKQLQIVNNLGGDRNAQRILQRMEKDGLIKSVRYEMKIYYLSHKGIQQLGSNKSELKKSQIIHNLMRNDLYIRLGMPLTWEVERTVVFNDDKLVPDARFVRENKFHFVEIDNKQTMATNIEKIKKYKTLFSIIFKKHNYHPILIWYTLSEVRKKKLKEACEKHGLKYVIY